MIIKNINLDAENFNFEFKYGCTKLKWICQTCFTIHSDFLEAFLYTLDSFEGFPAESRLVFHSFFCIYSIHNHKFLDVVKEYYLFNTFLLTHLDHTLSALVLLCWSQNWIIRLDCYSQFAVNHFLK